MRLSKTQISLSTHTVLLEPLMSGTRYTRTDFMCIANTDRTDRIPLVTRVFAGSTRNSHSVIIIIIIALFQEDNIFGRVASLTYGPQLTNVGMIL